jgi:hypothetical protein
MKRWNEELNGVAVIEALFVMRLSLEDVINCSSPATTVVSAEENMREEFESLVCC